MCVSKLSVGTPPIKAVHPMCTKNERVGGSRVATTLSCEFSLACGLREIKIPFVRAMSSAMCASNAVAGYRRSWGRCGHRQRHPAQPSHSCSTPSPRNLVFTREPPCGHPGSVRAVRPLCGKPARVHATAVAIFCKQTVTIQERYKICTNVGTTLSSRVRLGGPISA